MTTIARDPYAPVDPEIERRVAEIMKRPYRKVITGNADEGFLIQVPDLPGCMTAGDTMEEAIELLPDAMAGWLIVALERGVPIPEPKVFDDYSGKLLVRMPKTLHRQLIERAEAEGVSANHLAVALLAKGL